MADLNDGEGGFDEPTAPAWMATFGDLMSLLLTFFVLLMSFASMDTRKFAAIAGSMRDAFGVQQIHAGLIESLSDSLVNLSDSEASPMLRIVQLPTKIAEREQSVLERLKRAIEARELQRVVSAEKSPRGVLLRMDESLLFSEGSTELAPKSIVFLHDVADLIREVPGSISIEGHTDATRAGDDAGSNWSLAANRAVVVLTQLLEAEGIEADRLQATAFGDTRTIASNADERGRELNRRVEFVFLRTEIDLVTDSNLNIDSSMGGGLELASPTASPLEDES
jgi:chemotaxis protein MotB